MATEAQRAACKRYYERNKDLYKVVVLRLHRVADADVVEAFEKAPNKTQYVRELVRGCNRG